MTKPVLIRQPIFDRDLNVAAYELMLYDRSSEQLMESGTAAIPEALNAAFFENDFEQLLNHKKAIIPFSKSFLEPDIVSGFPADKIVLFLSDHKNLDASDIEKIKHFKSQGYQFAIALHEEEDLNRELIALCDFIKINYNAEFVDSLFESDQKEQPIIIASMIENYDKINACKEKGFQCFQGSFISKPNIIENKKIDSSQTVLLKILSELQKPNIEFEEIEKVVSQDANLSFKLLQYINSAAFASTRKIGSLREAIVRLGQGKIKQLVNIMSLTAASDKPSELMQISMIRAKMCELIAQELKLPNASSFFTVGLFSTLEAVLDMSWESLFQTLPLTDDLKNALMRYEGSMGEVLQNTIHYEVGDWQSIEEKHIDFDMYQESYLASVGWAGELLRAIK